MFSFIFLTCVYNHLKLYLFYLFGQCVCGLSAQFHRIRPTFGPCIWQPVGQKLAKRPASVEGACLQNICRSASDQCSRPMTVSVDRCVLGGGRIPQRSSAGEIIFTNNK